MITGLDHIAIAVPDLERTIRRFMEDFGLPFAGTEDVPESNTRTAFFPLPPTQIELVYPLDGEGPIARFLENRSGGLHHLCFRTDDVDGDMKRLRALGYVFTTEAPYCGAQGSRVAFIHPKSFDGVLIELSQPASPAPATPGD